MPETPTHLRDALTRLRGATSQLVTAVQQHDDDYLCDLHQPWHPVQEALAQAAEVMQ